MVVMGVAVTCKEERSCGVQTVVSAADLVLHHREIEEGYSELRSVVGELQFLCQFQHPIDHSLPLELVVLRQILRSRYYSTEHRFINVIGVKVLFVDHAARLIGFGAILQASAQNNDGGY